MKAKLFLASALWLAALVVDAQDTKPYWVIETNVRQLDKTIVRIYDQKNNLVHEETLKGQTLSVTKRKDRKLLDRKLKEVLKHETLASGKSKKHMN